MMVLPLRRAINGLPTFWLPLVLPGPLVRSVACALAGLCLGPLDLTREFLRGVGWHHAQLWPSLAWRRSFGHGPTGAREGSQRFIQRSLLIVILGQSALPRVPEGAARS